MKVFDFLFGFKNKRDNRLYKYEEGGLGGKITTLVLTTAFCVLSIFCELWAFKLFGYNFFYGLLAAFLTVALISVSVQTAAINASVGISAAAHKTAFKALDKTLQHIENPTIVANVGAEEPKKKTSRKFDIFFGVMSAILAAATVIVAIVLVFTTLSSL